MKSNESLVKHYESTLSPISQAVLEAGLRESLRVQELFERLRPAMEQALQRLRWVANLAMQEEKAITAFQDSHLWPTPSMSRPLMNKIVRLHSEGKSQVIPTVVARYYKKNDYATLKRAVAKWESNPYFLPRMQIFKDALEAHINGRYTLTIPALLPHIEGIAREIVEQYGLSSLEPHIEGGARTYPSTAFGHVVAGAFTFNESVAVRGLSRYLEGIMYLHLGRGFEKLPEFSKRKSKINRHAILHGVQTNYASYMNSLRVFLALDVLSLLNPEEDS